MEPAINPFLYEWTNPNSPNYDYEFTQDYRQDLEYLIYLLPVSLRPLHRKVNDFANRLEYNDSFMFDSFPDKNYLTVLAQKIYKELLDEASDNDSFTFVNTCIAIFAIEIITAFLAIEITNRKRRYNNYTRRFNTLDSSQDSQDTLQ